jgi:hypothetical protein
MRVSVEATQESRSNSTHASGFGSAIWQDAEMGAKEPIEVCAAQETTSFLLSVRSSSFRVPRGVFGPGKVPL